MNSRLNRLAERRESLVAQAAAQRNALAQNVAPWRAPLALADRGMEALRYIRRHPALLLGAALMFAAWRPGRAGKWTRFLWAGWQVGRRVFKNDMPLK
jgi:hypothetical protein